MAPGTLRLALVTVLLAFSLAFAPVARAEGSWEMVAAPNPGTVGPFANELHAVDGTTAADVWAVGAINPGPYYNSRATLAMHFDGASWTVVPTPNPDGSGTGIDVDLVTLSDVDAISPTDAWAVGSTGSIDQLGSQAVVLHWNGSAWSSVPVPRFGDNNAQNDLYGVAAVSPTDVWAVGSYTLWQEYGAEYGTLILHWDGTSWSVVPNGCNATEDVVAISSTDVWAVGDDTCHWDGSAWTPTPNAPVSSGYVRLRSVSAASSGAVWAVGFRAIPYFEGYLYSGRIERWDGSRWNAVNVSPAGNYLNGVVARAANDVWAVGTTSGLNLILHWDGSSWTSQDVPSPGQSSYLNDVGPAGADLWAVGIYFDTETKGRNMTLRRGSGGAGPGVATVTGTVQAGRGQPIAGATVSWTGPQNGSTSTDPGGRYEMISTTGGTYAMSASATGCRSRKASVSLSPGQDMVLNFNLRCG